jgi:hypothetical protein
MEELRISTRKIKMTLIAASSLEIEINRKDQKTLKLTTEILPIHFGSLISLYCSNQGQKYMGLARASSGESYVMTLKMLKARPKAKGAEESSDTPPPVSTLTPAAMLLFQKINDTNKKNEIMMLLNIYDMAKIRTWSCMAIETEGVDMFGSCIVQNAEAGLYIKTGGRSLVLISRDDCIDLARMLSLISMGIPVGYNAKNVSLYFDKSQNIPVLTIGFQRSMPDNLTLHRMMLHCEKYVYTNTPTIKSTNTSTIKSTKKVNATATKKAVNTRYWYRY